MGVQTIVWRIGGVLVATLIGLGGSGCGRDAIEVGGLADSCGTDADCGEGFSCVRGICRVHDQLDCHQPGLTSCIDSANSLICGDDGVARVQTCSPGLCVDGQCTGAACPEGDAVCADSVPYVCQEGRWRSRPPCGDREVCLDGTCRPDEAEASDIAIRRVSVGPPTLGMDGEITVDLSVSNDGAADTGPFECGVYASRTARPAYPNDPMYRSIALSSLGAGERGVGLATFSGWEIGPGEHAVYVHCDPEGRVREINELNNESSPVSVWVVDADFPDVGVDYFEFGPDRVRAGDEVEATAGIFNYGTASIEPSIACGVYLTANRVNPDQDVEVFRHTWDIRLGPGDSTELDMGPFVVPPLPRGDYFVYVRCDLPEQVDADDANNLYVAESTLAIRGGGSAADLRVESWIESPTLPDGGVATISGVVCNGGRAAASGFDLATEITSTAGLEQRIARMTVDRLGPDECREFSMDSTPLFCFDGELYDVMTTVDPSGMVIESDEGNNIWFHQERLRITGDACACVGPGCGCVGDRYDPDDIDRPPVVPNGEPLTLCPDDLDVFMLAASPGNSVQVNYFPDDGLASMRMRLVALANGQEIAVTDNIFDGTGSVFIPALPEASAYQLTMSDVAGVAVDYTLNVVVRAGAVPDLSVANIQADAAAVGQQFTINYVASNSGSVAGPRTDALYMSYPPDPTGWLRLAAVQRPSLGVGAFSGSLSALLPGDMDPGVTTFEVVLDDLAEVVEGDEGNNSAQVDVFVAAPVECADEFEPNDSTAEATAVTDGEYSALAICGDDEDYFRVCPEGDTLTMTITFNPDVDIDLALFDDTMARVAASQGLGDTESVSIVPAAGACYTLSVYAFGSPSASVGTQYTLAVEAGVAATCSQIFEPNNSFVEATSMADAEGHVIDFCPRGDADFFRTDLTADVGVLVEVTPLSSAPAGDLSLTVYGPTTNFVTQRFARDISLEFTPEETGTHYLRLVTTSGTDLFQYRIHAEASP